MFARFRMTIGFKIYAVIGLVFLGFIASVLLDARELGLSLQHQKQNELTHLGEVALAIIKEEHAAAQKGTIKAEDAQKRAAARIESLRYGQGDYFWINDMHHRMVMHPTNPKLNGQDLSDYKDPNGKALFVEMVDVVKRQGSGFVPYEWPKPGAEKPQPKLSYVAGFEPWGWMIGTGVYIDDLRQEIWESTRRALLTAGLLMLVTGFLAMLVARRTSRALHAMTAAMHQLADGNFDLILPGLGRKDEIGDVAGAVESFKLKSAEKARREAEEKAVLDRTMAAERKTALLALADRFENAVGGIVESVSSASSGLEEAASTLSKTAESTQQLSTSVAAASEQASSNVQTVAAAAGQLTSSVDEISRRVHESSQIANEAVNQAQQTDARITELSQAAGRIGDIVKLISTIAEQTNLLALNATIESARAGEAGKGFAVVAHEVKSLATQTAKATEEIGKQISGMQAATNDSVAAIKAIGGTIGHISEISTTIAAAVEEQGAATQEIARNVQQAAAGTTQVASNITEVNHGAVKTGSASGQVLASARSLSSESNRLKSEVQKFLSTIRAA